MNSQALCDTQEEQGPVHKCSSPLFQFSAATLNMDTGASRAIVACSCTTTLWHRVSRAAVKQGVQSGSKARAGSPAARKSVMCYLVNFGICKKSVQECGFEHRKVRPDEQASYDKNLNVRAEK